MAGALKDKQLVRDVYTSLQAASCPLLDGLYLQEENSMQQLLCVPSQHRTDILTWICSSINPHFATSKTTLERSSGPDVGTKKMALLGQELMLCKADDLELIRGEASPDRQLHFLQQLLTSLPVSRESAGPRPNAEKLLNELFAADNLPHFTQMLRPTLDPWPAHIKALRKGNKSLNKSSREDAADVAELLQLTRTTLEQLRSECEFLSSEPPSPGVFSPSSLRVAACDLQLLMSTFSHVYETDLRAYCGRDPPSFSADADIFQRIHQLLFTFIVELEMLQEVSEASMSMTEEVNQLQTKPCYWSRGEKRTLPNQLEELSRRIRDFFPARLGPDSLQKTLSVTS